MKNTVYILFLLLFAVTACQEQKNENNEVEEQETEGVVTLTPEQIKTVGIQVGDVEQRRMSGTISATGMLKQSPQDRAEVTSLVSGSAKTILVREGQNVTKGQTLAMVENTEIVALQKDYLVASSEKTLAQQEYNRQKALNEQGAGVAKTLQQAKTALDVATATETGLRRQLQQLGISASDVVSGNFHHAVPVVAPISGVVGEISISTGSPVSTETILMTLYNNKALHADLNVFESDIENIHIGQEVDMMLSANSSKQQFKGKVAFINAALNAETKAASVHVNLTSTNDATVLPNMYISAVIHCDDAQCQAVPSEAVVSSGGRSYVFVAEGDNTFRQTEVVTGLTQQNYTQITFVEPQSTMPKVVTAKAFYLQSMIADHGEEE